MKCMINRVVLLVATIFVTVGMATAVPEVSNVVMTQLDGSRTVKVTYDLSGEAAIVTLGIETNEVAIPDSAVTRLTGDVCKVVEPGTDKTIIWNAGADWPENRTESAKAKVTAWSVDAPPQVMVIDFSKGTAATESDPYPVYYYTSQDALPGGGLSNVLYKTDMLVMNKITSGSFSMGIETTIGTSVSVTLTQDFYIGVYEMTQKQWCKVMGTDPAQFKNPFGPVNNVSYNAIRGTVEGAKWPTNSNVDENSFMGLLRTRTGLEEFDLPTAAQWEYACRAGTTTYYNDGIDGSEETRESQLNDLGWWNGNSEASTHPVGQKTPNAWGLHDMHGNVWEWCLDWMGDLVAGTNPKGAESGSDDNRVRRGGGYDLSAHFHRSGYRIGYSPASRHVSIGFRLVRNLP